MKYATDRSAMPLTSEKNINPEYLRVSYAIDKAARFTKWERKMNTEVIDPRNYPDFPRMQKTNSTPLAAVVGVLVLLGRP
jgi:hypothetical protein